MFHSVRRISQGLYSAGDRVNVIGLQDRYCEQDLPAWSPLAPRAFPVIGPLQFGYGHRLFVELINTSPDIVHVHGLWMYPSFANLLASKRGHWPYLISPRGMLDSWALRNSRAKKRLVASLFENRHLRSAACIHALCDAEAAAVRAYGLKGPICIIPNGVDLEDQPVDVELPTAFATDAGQKLLLFLGRIHPKKGLPRLLESMLQVRRSRPEASEKWKLIIAGWDHENHSQELEAWVREHQLTHAVSFCGPLLGDKKLAALRASSAFILPSQSEGLPMAVLEAWAQRLPVAMTPECNIPVGFQLNAAVNLGSTPELTQFGLEQLFSMADDELKRIGSRGRVLVEEQFQWSKVVSQLRDVYEWAIHGGQPPESVRQV